MNTPEGLRDYFAAAALTGVLANQELLIVIDKQSPESTRVAASVYAYATADAMLKARIDGGKDRL